MFSFPLGPLCVSDKPPRSCCVECRMSLWRRHTEGVLSVCLHLSAPYISWVGWIAVREKLGGLVVWLKDTKARAALTCCCGMDLFSICLALLQVCHHSMRGTQIALSFPHSLFWIGVCMCMYIHTCVYVYLCGDCMFVQYLHCPHWNCVQLCHPSLLTFWCCWEEKENLALLVLAGLWLILSWSVLFQMPEPLINVICWNWSSFPVSCPG